MTIVIAMLMMMPTMIGLRVAVMQHHIQHIAVMPLNNGMY
jgi:hypothetical protein